MHIKLPCQRNGLNYSLSTLFSSSSSFLPGEDGIEELVDDLNSSKIMYGFIQVDDPNTSLAKFVMLNWQGETAPGTKKGICATHLKDVTNYFR